MNRNNCTDLSLYIVHVGVDVLTSLVDVSDVEDDNIKRVAGQIDLMSTLTYLTSEAEGKKKYNSSHLYIKYCILFFMRFHY